MYSVSFKDSIYFKEIGVVHLLVYYVTQRMWVGGLQNVTIPMQLEKFYYAKVLLEIDGWSKYQKKHVT